MQGAAEGMSLERTESAAKGGPRRQAAAALEVCDVRGALESYVEESKGEAFTFGQYQAKQSQQATSGEGLVHNALLIAKLVYVAPAGLIKAAVTASDFTSSEEEALQI